MAYQRRQEADRQAALRRLDELKAQGLLTVGLARKEKVSGPPEIGLVPGSGVLVCEAYGVKRPCILWSWRVLAAVTA